MLGILKKRYPKALHLLFEYGDMGLYNDDGLIAYKIEKKYSLELLKIALDKDFEELTYYQDEDEEYEDQDPSLRATYTPLHALIALADMEIYSGLKEIMEDFDNNMIDDTNYTFTFDYFCASAYSTNSQFINEILFDDKNSEDKIIRIFYIFNEVMRYFKDSKSLKSIEETTIKFLKLNNKEMELNIFLKRYQ